MPDNVRDIYAYDNLITMALTLNKSIHQLQQLRRTLDQFTYDDAEMARVFVENAGKTDFVGLTVCVLLLLLFVTKQYCAVLNTARIIHKRKLPTW